ncbi:hypothetical protein [Helicobacter aurati]|uniref:hypothetical protein n=1 Tax=Helicobacter aurati TaxID=137778 RepID=UPI000CF02902|nr:hypothetical protein [Helicobacter aurati]
MPPKEILRLTYLRALLYRQELLGDCFVDFLQSDSSKTHSSFAPHTTAQRHNTTLDMEQQPKMQTLSALQTFHDLEKQVSHCKLCSLANMTHEKARFCGVLPNKHLSKTAQSPAKFPKIAFVVESLRLQHLGNSLQCLEQSKSNTMLQNIISKVMCLELESVFIFPLFKCAAMQDNAKLSLRIQKEGLSLERAICKDYLTFQLQFVDYVVFFGKRLCQDFFQADIHETKGKILQYRTATNHIVQAVCVRDIAEMIANPALKRETLLNCNLLKECLLSQGRD